MTADILELASSTLGTGSDISSGSSVKGVSSISSVILSISINSIQF